MRALRPPYSSFNLNYVIKFPKFRCHLKTVCNSPEASVTVISSFLFFMKRYCFIGFYLARDFPEMRKGISEPFPYLSEKMRKFSSFSGNHTPISGNALHFPEMKSLFPEMLPKKSKKNFECPSGILVSKNQEQRVQ
jgi:hypothetical protein